MLKHTLLYIGAILPMVWGAAHLFPTKNVVAGFGGISTDNRHIITMEWIAEGVALIFIGVLVALTTYLDPESLAATGIYVVSAICLFVLAIVSLFTGFRINFLPFRLCPLIFSTAAVLLLSGAFT